MSKEQFAIVLETLSSEDVRGLVAAGDLSAVNRGDLTDEEVALLRDVAAQYPDLRDPEVTGYRDISTGQATGRRQWGPIRIVKEWGPASPQPLLDAARYLGVEPDSRM